MEGTVAAARLIPKKGVRCQTILASRPCFIIYSTKARFACVRAACGWSLPYQGSCIDPMDQSHPLDPTLKARGASGTPTIRLLKKDLELNSTLAWSYTCFVEFQKQKQEQKSIKPWSRIKKDRWSCSARGTTGFRRCVCATITSHGAPHWCTFPIVSILFYSY